MHIDSNRLIAVACAPASIANVIVGFDIMGFPFPALHDRVALVPNTLAHCRIVNIEVDDQDLPYDVMANTAGKALVAMLGDLGIDQGFDMSIIKGVPIGSGLGSSAASAVAAVVAANHFLDKPCSLPQLATYAAVGEQLVSGDWHIDNVAPALWGDLMLVAKQQPLRIATLPMPPLCLSVIYPHLVIKTSKARSLLSSTVPMPIVSQQGFYLANVIHALHQHDWSLLADASQDILIEPQRQHLLPGYADAKSAALSVGALNMGFAGAGPTVFAFSETMHIAQAVTDAITEQLTKHVSDCDTWTVPLVEGGARIVKDVDR